jgi:TLD
MSTKVTPLDMNDVIDNGNDVNKDLFDCFRLEAFEREKLSELWNQCCSDTVAPDDGAELDGMVGLAVVSWKSLHNAISPSSLTGSILSDAKLMDYLGHIWNHTTKRVRQSSKDCTRHDVKLTGRDSNTSALVDHGENAELHFHQSGTFCLFLETVASVCGRLPLTANDNGDVLDALWTAAAAPAAAQPDRKIHECLADLIYRLCHHAAGSSPMSHQNHERLDGGAKEPCFANGPCPDRPPAAWRYLLASSNVVSSAADTSAETLLCAEKWRQWAQRQIPAVTWAVYTLFYSLLLKESNLASPHQLHFCYPSIAPEKNATTLSDTTNTHSGPIASFIPQCALMGIFSPLADHAPSLCPLFQSNTDGFSMHTLAKALTTTTDMLGQPTILLIQTMRNEWLGYFTPVPWTMSAFGPTHQNAVDSFLFRLYPEWNIYRPIPESSPEDSDRDESNDEVQDTNDAPWIQRNRQNTKVVQYLNPPSAQQQDCRSVTRPGGLIVGTQDKPRLHLTPDMEECLALSFDGIFDPGPLLSDASATMGRFDVANLEVWAISGGGNDQSRDRAHAIASLQERVRQQCAKVDRAQFLDDFQTGLYENSLFQHRTQARGRADFCALDDRPGYFVEGKVPSFRKSNGAS